MSVLDLVRHGHASIGAIVLVSFWSAALTRKGSSVHRLSGKIHLFAMLPVVLLAVPLVLRRYADGQWIVGTFFAHVFLITALRSWQAWRAIRAKHDWRAYAGGTTRVLARATAFSGAASVGLGLYARTPLLFVFGALGVYLWTQNERLLRNGPESPGWWLREHTSAIIGNGIATHIAFLSLGLTRLFPALAGPVVTNLSWYGPLVVGLGAIYLLRRRQAARRSGTAVAVPVA